MRRRLTAIPAALREAWARLGSAGRRRLGIGLGALAALALLLVLAVPHLPCGFPGGERCPLPDDAEELVPGDAIAYVHVQLDPESPQRKEGAEIADRLPLFSSQVGARALSLVPGPGGRPPSLERDLEPWFAGEAAVALLPGPRAEPQQVELLEVSDAERASDFQARLAAGATASPREYRGVEIEVDARRLATAQVEGFLAVGSEDAVRAVVDTATGAEDASSFADVEEAAELRDELPEDRLADAYVSADGLQTLAGSPRAPLASFAPFLAPEASEGAAIALSADDGALELALRSRLDPERAEAEEPFFSAFPEFEPELPAELAADSLAYVGIGDPGSTVEALLGQASVEAPAIAAGFEDLLADLRKEGRVDLDRELLPALGGEAAFALAPRGGAPTGVPLLEFVATGVDEERVRRALAALQGPIAESVDPGAGFQAPVFGERDVAGIPTRSVRVSPAVELAYAVFNGLAVIATDPAAIERLAEGEGGLDEADGFRGATDDLGDEEVSLLAFSDLAGLVELAERAGLSEDPNYATFSAEFRSLDMLGLAVRDAEGVLSTDARLRISD